jgi:hypothetical protein
MQLCCLAMPAWPETFGTAFRTRQCCPWQAGLRGRGLARLSGKVESGQKRVEEASCQDAKCQQEHRMF